MKAIPCPYGFRIVGDCTNQRRLVDAGRAFAAYADCDEKAKVAREAYLSAFSFGVDFRRQLEATGSTRGFTGACWAPWVWMDLDYPDDLKNATEAARRLVSAILERYRISDDDVLAFFSGAKGFHIGIPTSVWLPEPSSDFNRYARRFAEHIAGLVGVVIDTGIYDKVRAFRAPNSRHPKTGRCKRRLSVNELLRLTGDAIARLCEHPIAFEVPNPTEQSLQASADWQAAVEHIERENTARRERKAANSDGEILNRLTLEFIRNGASQGDRHRLLFSAAANLGEFGCPPTLAHALLSDTARDSGLPPKDVRRQIDCGLESVEGGDSDG